MMSINILTIKVSLMLIPQNSFEDLEICSTFREIECTDIIVNTF